MGAWLLVFNPIITASRQTVNPPFPLSQRRVTLALYPSAHQCACVRTPTQHTQAPPSKVLGIIAGVPSGILGPASLVALAVVRACLPRV